MTTAVASHPLRDSTTMVRRNLKRMVRYPSMTVQLIAMPVLLLLLFVYVFGGTLGAGLGGPSGGRAEYVNYVVPAILLMTIASTVQGTAISVAMDMTEGIIARFRTMNIARVSVLTGHVIGSLIQAFLSLAVVIGVALLIGFEPRAASVTGSPSSVCSPPSRSRWSGSPWRSARLRRPSRRPAACRCR